MPFTNSLNTSDEAKLTQWLKLSVDGDHSQSDDHSMKSSTTTSIISNLDQRQPFSKQRPGFLNRAKRMCTTFPFQDMSFMVGVIFTVGSAAFVANGFFLILPLIVPQTIFTGETSYATPISSVLGGIIFVLGGYAGVLEGLNLKRRCLIVTEEWELMLAICRNL